MVNPLKYIKTFFHREVERVDTNNSRKRKREADDCDQGEHNGRWQDDDDVIITAVKRPRTDNQQAFKFFNNFIGNPLEKMSEWFKNKKVWRPSYMQNSSYQESRELAGERFKPPDPSGRNGRLRDGSGHLQDGTSHPEERQVSQNMTIPIIQSKQQARQSINKQASTSHRPFYKKKTPPPQEASVIQHAPPTSTQNQTSVSSPQQTVQQQQSGPRHSHIQTMSVPIQTGMSYASVLKAGPSTVSRGVQGLCGNGKQSLFEMKPYKKFAATECIKMEEREKYKQLLQQFTTVPLSLSPPRSHDSDRVSISSRGSSRAQDSIHGDTICRNYSSQRKSITPEDSVPRQKVVPVHIVKSDASFLSRRFNPDFLNSTRVNHILNDSSRQVSKKKLWSSPERDDDNVKCVNKDRVGNRDRSELRTENRERLENTEDVICIGDDEAAEISAIPKVNGDISHFERSRLEGRKSPFSDALQESVYLKEDWMTNIVDRFSAEKRERRRKILEEEARVKYHEEQRKTKDENLVKKIQSQMRIYEKEPAVIEDIPIPEIEIEEEEEFPEDIPIPEIEIEEEEEFPELTDDMQRVIKDALRPHPADQVLVEGYKLQITRTDVSTLAGLNWLNDEIINFYMNMLMERGEAEGKPKVHAFNTFFYPKILNGGHSSVRRWTKRVDVFAMDYILIPVHLGMHWCLAVVDFRKKVIRYYDSMGGQNNQCLNAIKKYLCEESLDKKKQEFDLNGWRTEIAKDIPQQMNGSDCGMFACKFAEYITREAKITFSQENMPYFRRRMVYEIVKKKLLQ